MRGLLFQRCTIQRFPDDGAQDSHGKPAQVWADIATNVACRRRVAGGAETFADEDKTATAAREIIYLNRGQDITEKDRIVLESVTYDVLRVNRISAGRREHHRRVECVAVR